MRPWSLIRLAPRMGPDDLKDADENILVEGFTITSARSQP
jgi:hypothetical protein